jgi:hypothetical protein
VSLASTLGEGEWSVYNPGERALGTDWIWSWVGSAAGLEAVERRKIEEYHLLRYDAA